MATKLGKIVELAKFNFMFSHCFQTIKIQAEFDNSTCHDRLWIATCKQCMLTPACYVQSEL